jgi:hypothetical protein
MRKYEAAPVIVALLIEGCLSGPQKRDIRINIFILIRNATTTYNQ